MGTNTAGRLTTTTSQVATATLGRLAGSAAARDLSKKASDLHRSPGFTRAIAAAGERDAAVLASALRHLHLYLTYPDQIWSGTITSVSNTQIQGLLEEHPNMRSAVERGRRLAQAVEMIPSAAAVGVYVTERWGGQPATALADWYTGLTTGAGLEVDSPASALRDAYRRLRDRTSSRRYRDTRAHLGPYLRAWNAWADNEGVHRLQMPSRMPRLPRGSYAAA